MSEKPNPSQPPTAPPNAPPRSGPPQSVPPVAPPPVAAPPIAAPPPFAAAQPPSTGIPPNRASDSINQFEIPPRATGNPSRPPRNMPLGSKPNPESPLPSDEPPTSPIAQESLWTSWIKESPSWLVSTLVHVSIILLLALIPFHEEVTQSLTLLLGSIDGGDSGNELATFDINEMDTLQGQSDSDAMEDFALSVADVAADIPDLSNVGTGGAMPEFSIRKGLTGRTGNMKGALLKAYGGTGLTEDAVALGLDWLKRNQTSDGSWSLVGPFDDGGVSENRAAATALALLAFMGAGSTHQSGEYQPNVFRGLNYLIRLQDDEGFFAGKATGIQKTYSQAQASIAICELYGMTGDEKLKEPALRAVRYAIAAQHEGGGWRYQPREAGDTSVTGWYVMALISARMSGLDVPSEVMERIHAFLDTVQRKQGVRGPEPDGELYAYQAFGNAKDSMTAEGMLCRMYLGWRTDDPRILAGCEHIARHPVVTSVEGRDYYYWYYATNALHHAGGGAWRKWNAAMREALPALQEKTGRDRGSWPPQGDPHGAAGGRLYSTVLSILCLEAYYRHMPLSEMASPK